ncbi:transcriptional regulator [Acidovorax sp. LjRoot74]|uniref:transcriptional regulator n=1 Tax=Acidovorax sp. LjRoot74 TaxID=3342337 RepID=UPI003ECD6D57
MTQLEDQHELALARAPQRSAVPLEMIRAQRTAAAAFTLACSVSGLEDKEIYLALEIDAGYFSNIKKGKATLQADLVAHFCEVVGNTIYPEWGAFQVGCTLVMVKTEAERRAELAEQRAIAAEAENRLMRQLLQGRATA